MASSISLKRFILAELRNRGVSATKDGMATLVEIARETPQENIQRTFDDLLDAAIKEDCECSCHRHLLSQREPRFDCSTLPALCIRSGSPLGRRDQQRRDPESDGDDAGGGQWRPRKVMATPARPLRGGL